MEFKSQPSQLSQPNPAPQRPLVQPQAEAPQNITPGGASGGRKLVLAIIGAVIALIVVVGGLMLWQMNEKNANTSSTSVDTSKYQALFMTNGQVYFGKLSKISSDYAELTNVYYLQVQQDVQPAPEQKDTTQPQVSLTKLGNELHGPTDRMFISRDQILFWENLKDDSTVVKAIKDYEAKQ